MDSGLGQKLTIAICLVIGLCFLFAPIGVNEAFASYDPPQEDQGYRDTPQSPGTLTISGTWMYYDRDNEDVPAKGFYAELPPSADECSVASSTKVPLTK